MHLNSNLNEITQSKLLKCYKC